MNTLQIDSMQTTNKELIRRSLSSALSYSEYRALVESLAKEGRTTGSEQTEALVNYTRLNDRRMKRWEKTLKFDSGTVDTIAKFNKKVTWLVLTESWCGDASPSMPVMHKIAELNPNISFRIVLRDENLELMQRFLTHGAMSIPKLIVIDDLSGEVLDTWGPRSQAATKLVEDYKATHGVLTPEFKPELQLWYNKDKGKSVVKDLTGLLLE